MRGSTWVVVVFAIGFLIGAGAASSIANEIAFPVRQRACWFEVQAKHGDTLTVVKLRPDCRNILLPKVPR